MCDNFAKIWIPFSHIKRLAENYCLLFLTFTAMNSIWYLHVLSFPKNLQTVFHTVIFPYFIWFGMWGGEGKEVWSGQLWTNGEIDLMFHAISTILFFIFVYKLLFFIDWRWAYVRYKFYLLDFFFFFFFLLD